MAKVTISIEFEDGDYSKAARASATERDDAAWLLADCIASIANARHSSRLHALAEAAYEIARADR